MRGKHSGIQYVEYKKQFELDIMTRLDDNVQDDTDPEDHIYGDITVYHNDEAVQELQQLNAYFVRREGFVFATSKGVFSWLMGSAPECISSKGNCFAIEEKDDGIYAYFYTGMTQTAFEEHRDTCGYMFEEWHNVYKINATEERLITLHH